MCVWLYVSVCVCAQVGGCRQSESILWTIKAKQHPGILRRRHMTGPPSWDLRCLVCDSRHKNKNLERETEDVKWNEMKAGGKMAFLFFSFFYACSNWALKSLQIDWTALIWKTKAKQKQGNRLNEWKGMETKKESRAGRNVFISNCRWVKMEAVKKEKGRNKDEKKERVRILNRRWRRFGNKEWRKLWRKDGRLKKRHGHDEMDGQKRGR